MEHENGRMNGTTRPVTANGAGPGAGEAAQMYRELRRLSARELARFPRDRQLGVSSVVSRLFVRLAGNGTAGAGGSNGQNDHGGRSAWSRPTHFYCLAAKAMRQVIIDDCRRHNRRKRGGGQVNRSLDGLHDPIQADPDLLLDLDEALGELEQVDPEALRVIELRFFGGLSNRQVGDLLGVTERTIERHARAGRAWLARRIKVGWGVGT